MIVANFFGPPCIMNKHGVPKGETDGV